MNIKAHEAKLMKVWEVLEVKTNTSDATKKDITLNASWLTPKLVATDIVMVVPANINADGKGVVAGTVTDNGDGTVTITVSASAIDEVAAGDYLSIASAAKAPKPAGYYDAESTDEGALKVVASGAEAGEINLADVTPYQGSKTLAADDYVIWNDAEAGAYLAVKGNIVLTRDLKAGNGQNFVDVPRGELYCYVNTVNGIPAAVIAAAREIGLFIEPEYFAEVDAN